MTQEEKNLLLKDLSARVKYGVKFTLSGDNIYTMKGIDLIVTYDGDWEYAVTAKGIKPIEIEYIKPYLRPMSSMTDEEQDEFLDLIIPVDGGKAVVEEDKIEKYNEFIYSHHIDNKNLIEKGLALEAPEGMY